MTNPLLQRRSPRELANRGQVIEITGKLDDFSRLVEIIEADLSLLKACDRPQKWRQAPVDIRLRYGWVEDLPGMPLLEGRLSTSVPAVCQRCLEPFEMAVATELKLLLPESRESTAAQDGYEVWEFDEREVRSADIVEEALIMAMPLSALHESSDECGVLAADHRSDDGDTIRPFAELKSLMAQTDDEN